MPRHGIGSALKARAYEQFLDSLTWRDIFDLGGVWDRAKAHLHRADRPAHRLRQDRWSATSSSWSRTPSCKPLAALARGHARLRPAQAVLGQDPITGEPVPRTPETCSAAS